MANAALLVNQIKTCSLISEELREIRESERIEQEFESIKKKDKKK